MKISLLVLVSIVGLARASDPTPEQLSLMQQYHLTVPPIILDSKDSTRVPDIAAGRGIDVHTEENGKQIDVTFGVPEPVELPLSKKSEIKAEIIAEIVEVTDQSFNRIVTSSKGVLVVEFYANWCVPCRQLAPILDSLAKDAVVSVARANFERSRSAAATLSIFNLPAIVVYRDGVVSGPVHFGVVSKETILSWAGTTSLSPATRHYSQPVSLNERSDVQYSPAAPQTRACGHSWGRP